MSKKSRISIAMAFQKGFTLLETLLVTLVLAGLVLFTVMSVRSSSEQTLVKQTAVELQNLLTAELAYYATKSTTGDYKWATSINTLFSNSYMPSSAQCSSWPSTTSTSCIGNRATYVVETTDERSKYVSVSITLPDAATAQAVARQLPIAGVNNNKVTAYAPIPASISNQRARRQTTIGGTDASQRGWITSVGDIGQNNRNSPLYAGDWCWGGRVLSQEITEKFSIPPCPAGFKPHYILFYKKQMTGHAQALSFDFTEHRYIEFRRESTNYYRSNGQLYYKVYLHNQSSHDDPHHSYYMTMCLPEGSWYSYRPTTGDDREQQCLQPWIPNNPPPGMACGTKM